MLNLFESGLEEAGKTKSQARLGIPQDAEGGDGDKDRQEAGAGAER